MWFLSWASLVCVVLIVCACVYVCIDDDCYRPEYITPNEAGIVLEHIKHQAAEIERLGAVVEAAKGVAIDADLLGGVYEVGLETLDTLKEALAALGDGE